MRSLGKVIGIVLKVIGVEVGTAGTKLLMGGAKINEKIEREKFNIILRFSIVNCVLSGPKGPSPATVAPNTLSVYWIPPLKLLSVV